MARIPHFGCALFMVVIHCLVLGTMVLTAGAGEDFRIPLTYKEEQWRAKHKTIRIGVDPDWPPVEFTDKNGVHQGIASEVVRIVSSRLGIRMTLVPNQSWHQIMDKAKKRQIDVLPCASRTKDREKFLLFTRPYLNIPVVILARTDAPYIGGLEDLYGKTLAIVRDYQLHERLPRDHPVLDLRVMESAEEAVIAVSKGKVFAYAGALATTSYLIPKLGISNLEIAAPTPYSYKLSFAVRDDWPELVDMLDKALATISQQERTSFSQKWISFESFYRMDYRVLFKWGAVAILIIVVILLWNMQIRRQKEAVRRSQEQLQTIMDSVPNVVFVTDLEGKKVLVNTEWENVTGLNREHAIGQSYTALYREELARQFSDADRKVRETLRPLTTEQTARTPEGTRTFVNSLVPLLDAERRPYAICGTNTDITERKQAEDQLQAAYAESTRLLAEASRYVQTLLPPPAKYDGIQTDWRFIPSAALGGDCFGYHWLDDDSFALYLIDVSGHGVSAALLAVTVLNVLRSRTLAGTDLHDPSQVLSALNDTFPMEQQNGMYFTMWYGVYTKSSRALAYSSAGHPAALLRTESRNANDRTLKLATPNLFIGGMPGIDFESNEIRIDEPSRLYLFSDGVFEIEKGDGTIWGYDDFVDFIGRQSPTTDSVLDRILERAREYNTRDAFEDDFSILVVSIE